MPNLDQRDQLQNLQCNPLRGKKCQKFTRLCLVRCISARNKYGMVQHWSGVQVGQNRTNMADRGEALTLADIASVAAAGGNKLREFNNLA